MEPLIVFLDKEREVRSSVLYKSKEGAVQNVYVRKEHLPTPYPKRIKMTIEAEDEK